MNHFKYILTLAQTIFTPQQLNVEHRFVPWGQDTRCWWRSLVLVENLISSSCVEVQTGTNMELTDGATVRQLEVFVSAADGCRGTDPDVSGDPLWYVCLYKGNTIC